MGIFLWSLLCFGILGCLLLISNLRAQMELCPGEGMRLRVWLAGIPVYRKKRSLSLRNFLQKKYISMGRRGKTGIPRLVHVLLHTGLRYGRLEVRLGVGDAAQTALTCGWAYTLLQSAAEVLLPVIQIQVQPVFEKECLTVEGMGIFRLRMVQIITIIIKEKRQRNASH